jgi:hypothetical protein
MKYTPRKHKKQHPAVKGVVLVAAIFILFTLVYSNSARFDLTGSLGAAVGGIDLQGDATGMVETKVVQHISTPESVKAIYMTACVASTNDFKDRVVALVDETEINTIVIDIKDFSGTIAIDVPNIEMAGEEGTGCRVKDMEAFVKSLHEKGIYVVGRITVFQDPIYAKAHPDQAVQRASDRSVWKDRKGISFVDVGAREYWDYIMTLSKASYIMGFDEINYDYVRFPSDGDMKNIYFPFSESKIVADPENGRATALREFFSHLYNTMKDTDVKTSADLFGMTMTNTDDLNIGQVLENTIPYFDYVCPMVYPSHYPSGFNNYKDVNAHPYDIVKFSMDAGVRRVNEYKNSTSTPDVGRGKENMNQLQLRPWLQDNDYPVPYTPAMVRTQIQATYDAGLNSWLLWDAGNTYTREALKTE